MIENADPGFDWIFSQNILALITKYGGANSHMAIRCNEFGIPAAIGCGEQRFEAIKSSKYIIRLFLESFDSFFKNTKNKSMVIWLIGLSGAGKTTIGELLYLKMKAIRPNTVFIDGDKIREVMGGELGHSLKDRKKRGSYLSFLPLP